VCTNFFVVGACSKIEKYRKSDYFQPYYCKCYWHWRTGIQEQHPSMRSMVADEEWMMMVLAGVNALSFLRCFDTVGSTYLRRFCSKPNGERTHNDHSMAIVHVNLC